MEPIYYKIEIYTDGSCSNNDEKVDSPGGWAAILRSGSSEKVLSGNELNTTNNRMEITAVLKSLEYLKKSDKLFDVIVFSDSKYVCESLNGWLEKWTKNGWVGAGKKKVKNQDLWRRIWECMKDYKVQASHIKGHNGHLLNERCDKIANQETIKAKNRTPVNLQK